jgi:hypothetical protein
MKGPTALARHVHWASLSRDQRVAALAGVIWVTFSAGFVVFMLILTAAQQG